MIKGNSGLVEGPGEGKEGLVHRAYRRIGLDYWLAPPSRVRKLDLQPIT